MHVKLQLQEQPTVELFGEYHNHQAAGGSHLADGMEVESPAWSEEGVLVRRCRGATIGAWPCARSSPLATLCAKLSLDGRPDVPDRQHLQP